MKILLSSIIIVFILTYGVVWFDTQQDRENILRVKKDSIAFEDWKCGYLCNTPIFKVYDGEKYNVLRIRYGKGFMAFKIKSKNGLTGWTILDGQYEITKLEHN
ncbi:hypothetical protein [Sulfurovum sp. NBC37-1]|uniref:hypothetical protein n=1 Tax=Sulfurovum sp. (strain NBC37-1) TaxID=387093 RepID=UPI000158746C|nr:hypothetical protein [Sulfurovum sp. NBC37-1]BAF71435.1 conserved hypothetical protein [Sulfurovum sp. NBC37-1]